MGGSESKTQRINVINDVQNTLSNTINISQLFEQNTKQGVQNIISQTIALRCANITAAGDVSVINNAKIDATNVQEVSDQLSQQVLNQVQNGMQTAMNNIMKQISKKGLNDMLSNFSPSEIIGDISGKSSKEELETSIRNTVKNEIRNTFNSSSVTKIIREQLMNNSIVQVITIGGNLMDEKNRTPEDVKCNSKSPNVTITSGGQILFSQEAAIKSVTKQIASSVVRQSTDNKTLNKIFNQLQNKVDQESKEMDPFDSIASASKNLFSNTIAMIVIGVVILLVIILLFVLLKSKSSTPASVQQTPIPMPMPMRMATK